MSTVHARNIGLAGLLALSGFALTAYPAAAAAETITSSRDASYVLMEAGSRSTTMSGSMEDLRRARALRAGSEALLYVRQGRAAYVIRDSVTLRQAKDILAPQQALGSRQAELGSRQAALGSQQARLGALQARLGSRQALASSRESEELGRQQEALGRQQDALGVQQETLGRYQEELGRRQEREGRIAEQKLGALITDAIRRGVAQRVN